MKKVKLVVFGGIIGLVIYTIPLVRAVSGSYIRTNEVVDLSNAWDYAPTAISFSDNPLLTHIFWCTTGKNAVSDAPGPEGDIIFYATYDINSLTLVKQPVKVLWPEANKWDSYHNCDPSVIAGKFDFAGIKYDFALYYTGTDNIGNRNRIGVAFSNDLVNWVKYPQPIILPDVFSNDLYGAGQSSVYNVDGEGGITIFYTDISPDTSGKTIKNFYLQKSVDGINFSNKRRVSVQGLPDIFNMDAPMFAHDYETGKWYLTVGINNPNISCPLFPKVFDHMETNIYVTEDIINGTWQFIASITNSVDENMDHNPTFLTDIYGNITPFKKTLPIFFGHGSCGLDFIKTWQLFIAQGNFYLQGDVNQNGIVDVFDFNLIITDYSKSGQLITDLDSDAKVNSLDAVVVLANFGKSL